MDTEAIKDLLNPYLIDKETGAYLLDCGHIVHPGHHFIVGEIGKNLKCFCDNQCYGEYLAEHNGYNEEIVPDSRRLFEDE